VRLSAEDPDDIDHLEVELLELVEVVRYSEEASEDPLEYLAEVSF
jgi:hypothetical protein